MTEVLCLAPDCRLGMHRSDCPGRCTGCLGPARARDGMRLCDWHVARLHEWPMQAAELYAELELVLTQSGTGGERVSSPSPSRGLAVNIRAVECRHLIRHQMVAWCRLVAEERGIDLPGRWVLQDLPYGVQGPLNRTTVTDDTIPAMARYLTRHADWLAAHPAAADAATELREMTRDARRVAYPSGARTFQVRHRDGQPVACPEVVDGEPCPGRLATVLRQVDSLLPSELRCTHDGEHRIPALEWIRMGKRLLRQNRKQEVA